MSRLLRLAPIGAALVLIAPTLRAQVGAGVPVAQEFERLHFRSIGPSIMSGRISDLAVYERDPAIYYVATAHSGVWKTTSNASDFVPLFQDQSLMSIGAIAVSQRDPDIVWIGTGEVNNRQTTSFGDGLFKSTDGGRTWQHLGFQSSRHIARIIIHPNDDNTVLMATPGSLFGPGGDRGIYKTTDGGRTWKHVLSVDSLTGATELVMAPSDPRTLFAATYQRRRHALGMTSNGPGSAIWKSTDGGDTWTKLTGGLPAGFLGRVGLAVYQKSASIVYATIEVGGGRGGRGAIDPDAEPDSAGGGRGGRGAGGRGGAAAAVPGLPGGGTGTYRSDDGGATWRFMSGTNPRPSYFSQIRIDPNNPDRLYMGGVGLHMSVDGGRTFETDAALVTHDDIHAIWINPANSSHILLGNDGGLAVSHDMARRWTFIPNLTAGLFYHVNYDLEVPYNICGGMQDNYNWCGPSQSRMGRGIMAYDWFQIQGGDGFEAIPDKRDSRIIYTESQNGNMIRRNRVTGESKNIRPTPDNVVNAQPGDPPYRFNWDSPMRLSPTDPGVLFVAGNRVFRSIDRGDSWTVISPDLTRGTSSIYTLAESPAQAGVIYTGSDNGVAQATRDGGRTWTDITANLPGLPRGAIISEIVPSRFAPGTVYVTADAHFENNYEPYIWMSTDFGATFRSINGTLRGTNVRTITEDTKNADVLYIGTESGIFLTLDRGRTWRRLKANLPMVRVDELTIHPRENSLLVATHGRALWVLDHLEPIQEYAAAQAAAGDAKLFSVPNALQWKTLDNRNDEFWGHQFFTGENPPTEAVIQLHLKRPVNDLKLRITDAAGARVRELPITGNRNQAGIQTVCWDQRVEPISAGGPPAAGGAGGRAGGGAGGGGAGGRAGAGGAGPIPDLPVPLPPVGYMAENPCGGGGGGGRGGGGGAGAGPQVIPGTYNVALVAGDRVLETKAMRIVMDPQVQLTGAARARWNEVLMDLHDMQRRGAASASTLNALASQMQAAGTRVRASSEVPAATKTQFEALSREFDAVRVKFGVGGEAADSAAAAPAGGRGGGGRGGRGGGGGGPSPSIVARAEGVKTAIMGIWETPSASLMQRYTEVKTALPAAIAEANAFVAKASAMSATLRRYNITFDVGR